LQDVFADLLDAASDAETMEGAEGVESLEDHEVEGALQDFGFFGVHFVPLDIAKKIAGVLWNVHRAGIVSAPCFLRRLRA
jgi:hypothetical protein